MFKNLVLPFSILRLKVRMRLLQMQIRKMESVQYLNLQERKHLAFIKKILNITQEKEAALHQRKLTVGF